MTKSLISRRSHPDTDASWADAALRASCAATGLDPAGARLIKFTNNAVYALKNDPVVVRIAGSTAVRNLVPKIVATARWLTSNDLPTVRLAEEYPQPLQLDGTAVTFWQRVDGCGQQVQPDGRDLGRILRRFHDLAAPNFELPQWSTLSSVRRRIQDEDVLADNDHEFLVTVCDELEQELTDVGFVLPLGPIHGDAFVGNLIGGPGGTVLCDFDSVAIGPREWDLTPIAVGRLRFDYNTDYHEQLASEYGVDVLEWPGFPVLRKIRELQLVTSVLPTLRSNPSLYEQWSHRFESFRRGDRAAVWTTYR
ncbi:phosphotransferase [Nocardia gipuzkoensis]|uniref:phosphotransferase n=1 Tax=Nocardia gipuzkoensis TaxID=2749991 RepID=UPI0015EEE994|nr:aminoglycoside phosphotransferase family protein [Nocardia gipuzkoensis]